MGACASKFTVLKNTSTAPPPAVKYEAEPKEVNLVEEVAAEKDDAPAVEDDANRRQSLGHLLQEVKSVYLSAFTLYCVNTMKSSPLNILIFCVFFLTLSVSLLHHFLFYFKHVME